MTNTNSKDINCGLLFSHVFDFFSLQENSKQTKVRHRSVRTLVCLLARYVCGGSNQSKYRKKMLCSGFTPSIYIYLAVRTLHVYELLHPTIQSIFSYSKVFSWNLKYSPSSYILSSRLHSHHKKIFFEVDQDQFLQGVSVRWFGSHTQTLSTFTIFRFAQMDLTEQEWTRV